MPLFSSFYVLNNSFTFFVICINLYLHTLLSYIVFFFQLFILFIFNCDYFIFDYLFVSNICVCLCVCARAHVCVFVCVCLYVCVYILYILLVKSFWTVRFVMFFKEVSSAHQACIYLIRRTEKNSKLFKYFCNIKYLFPIWIYLKMYCISVISKHNFSKQSHDPSEIFLIFWFAAQICIIIIIIGFELVKISHNILCYTVSSQKTTKKLKWNDIA